MKLHTGSGTGFRDPTIRKVFENHDEPVRERLLELRELIIDEAGRHPEIGELQETLKWGQPSYLPARPRVGTTLRIDGSRKQVGKVGLYFNCNTSLADDYRQLYPGVFEFEGNRAILLEVNGALDEKALRHCIALALTYHLNKKR